MSNFCQKSDYGLKKGAEEFPLMVVVSASYACNARCPVCPFTQSGLRSSFKDAPFIAPETFKKVADQCGEYGAWIRITGGGEPLLHPQMLELIEYAKGVGAKVGLITNGSLLNSYAIHKLLAADIDAIDISADASDEETYSKVRVGLDFNNLLHNVKMLVFTRGINCKTKTKIVVSIVDQKAIEGKLDSAIKFWKKIVDNVQVRKYLTWGVGDATQSGNTAPLNKDQAPCPLLFERIVVDSRGKLVLCSYDIAGKTDFGNVNQISIKEAWRGEKLEGLRKRMLEGKLESGDLCSSCADWKYRSWDYNYWKVLKDAGKV